MKRRLFAKSVFVLLSLSPAILAFAQPSIGDDVPARGSTPPGASAPSIERHRDTSGLTRPYVRIRGRVATADGKGISGAQIYWAWALTPSSELTEADIAEQARQRAGVILAPNFEGRRPDGASSSAPSCSFDPRVLNDRKPLATTRADGSYEIVISASARSDACFNMIAQATLASFPALAANKKGYVFRSTGAP